MSRGQVEWSCPISGRDTSFEVNTLNQVHQVAADHFVGHGVYNRMTGSIREIQGLIEGGLQEGCL